ncbi:hypothetical protein [Streptomyces sp. NPDC055036]
MSDRSGKAVAYAFCVAFSMILGAICGAFMAAFGGTAQVSITAGAVAFATLFGLGLGTLRFFSGD